MKKLDASNYQQHLQDLVHNKESFVILYNNNEYKKIIEYLDEYFRELDISFIISNNTLDLILESENEKTLNINSNYIIEVSCFNYIEITYNYKKFSYLKENLNFENYKEALSLLIKNKESFKIKGISPQNTLDVCAKIEEYIESIGLKCRVYTKNRILMSVLNPIAILGGIAVHNMLTNKPDYEIARDLINNTIEVIYKK